MSDSDTAAMELAQQALELLAERGWQRVNPDSPWWVWHPSDGEERSWHEALEEERQIDTERVGQRQRAAQMDAEQDELRERIRLGFRSGAVSHDFLTEQFAAGATIEQVANGAGLRAEEAWQRLRRAGRMREELLTP